MKKILNTILIACLLLLTCACSNSNHYKENSKIVKIENYIDYIKFDKKEDLSNGVAYYYVFTDGTDFMNSASEYLKVMHSIEDYLNIIEKEQGFTWVQISTERYTIYNSNNIEQLSVGFGVRKDDSAQIILVTIPER